MGTIKRIYCISGLGADQRIFQKLAVKDAELIFVPWVPFDKHDGISCYAQKLSDTIPGDNPYILGISFGGMLAVEIARQRAINKVFLVSSAKTIAELSGGTGGFLTFIIKHNLLPAGLFKTPNRFLFERFGATTDEEKQLLSAILHDSDAHFMKWAFKALLTWTNMTIPPNITHIHGTADRIIRPENIKPNHWIEGGTHMMTYNRAAEISALIEKHLYE